MIPTACIFLFSNISIFSISQVSLSLSYLMMAFTVLPAWVSPPERYKNIVLSLMTNYYNITLCSHQGGRSCSGG